MHFLLAIPLLLGAPHDMERRVVLAEYEARNGRYLTATQFADEVLSSQDDGFIGRRGMKQRAFAVLQAAPRAVYESQFGPQAKKMLDAAAAARNWNALQTVAQRFFFTSAGFEAAVIVALDGSHRRCKRWIAKFRTSNWADEYEPKLSESLHGKCLINRGLSVSTGDYTGVCVLNRGKEKVWEIKSEDFRFVKGILRDTTVYAVVSTGVSMELMVIRDGKILHRNSFNEDVSYAFCTIVDRDGIVVCVLPRVVVAYDTLMDRLLWRVQGEVHPRALFIYDAVLVFCDKRLMVLSVETGREVKTDDWIQYLWPYILSIADWLWAPPAPIYEYDT